LRKSAGVRIDIAVGDGHLTALVRQGTATLATVDVASAEVAAAMAEVRRHADAAAGGETTGARARIALMPPLADARLLALPPLRAAEAAAVVRRDAGRHFLGIAAPRVTAVMVPRRGSGAPVLAACASAVLVHDVTAAVRQAGWVVEGVAAAHGAWIAAARRAGAGNTRIIAVHAGAAHVIHADDGAPVAMRRVPAGAVEEIAAALGAEPAGVAIFAPERERAALAARLSGGGWQVAHSAGTAMEVAARHVGESRLHLVTDSVAGERRQQQRRLAVRLAAGAVVMLVAAAGVELWGAQRQLEQVRAERAAIRPQVQPLLAMRDSLDALRLRSGAVEDAARQAPRWTFAIQDLAMLLPEGAHVTRLTATGDTLAIEAEGAGAGAALQALRAAPSLQDARLVGVVERELADGATARERFRITALLAPRRAQ
jgi:hypothetical protein